MCHSAKRGGLRLRKRLADSGRAPRSTEMCSNGSGSFRMTANPDWDAVNGYTF